MLFRRRRPTLTRQQALDARPVRAVEGELQPVERGGARLKVKLQARGWSSFVFRLPTTATKTFELDPMGLLVWEACDGRNSVRDIIGHLAERYKLNLREAEVPTISFLQTLTRKGLIALAGPEAEKKGAKK